MIKILLSAITANYLIFLCLGFIKEGIGLSVFIKSMQMFIMANLAPLFSVVSLFSSHEPNKIYIIFGIIFLLLFMLSIIKLIPVKYILISVSLYSICWGLFGYFYLVLSS